MASSCDRRRPHARRQLSRYLSWMRGCSVATGYWTSTGSTGA